MTRFKEKKLDFIISVTKNFTLENSFAYTLLARTNRTGGQTVCLEIL